MESKYNLKPCPFCGAPAHMWKTNYCVYIECKEYNAADHQIEVSGRTEEEAAEAWNRRTPEKGFWYALEKGEKGYSAGDFKCSICGMPNVTYKAKPNFCPNCGADMRGEL